MPLRGLRRKLRHSGKVSEAMISESGDMHKSWKRLCVTSGHAGRSDAIWTAKSGCSRALSQGLQFLFVPNMDAETYAKGYIEKYGRKGKEGACGRA